MTWYRVVYRDGSHGAWTSDREWAYTTAKLFRAEVEVWTAQSKPFLLAPRDRAHCTRLAPNFSLYHIPGLFVKCFLIGKINKKILEFLCNF